MSIILVILDKSNLLYTMYFSMTSIDSTDSLIGRRYVKKDI